MRAGHARPGQESRWLTEAEARDWLDENAAGLQALVDAGHIKTEQRYAIADVARLVIDRDPAGAAFNTTTTGTTETSSTDATGAES